MPGVALQNDNFISTRVENSGGHPSMESELVEVRKFVQEKIYEFLKRRQQQVGEKSSKRVFDIIRRLDDALFKIAATEEEYMDLETLESRLLFLFRRSSASNRSQHFPHANSSSAGTMIRTHGIPRSENASLMVTSSAEASVISSTNCSSIASKNVSRVSCLPSENRLSDGPLAYGYEQSPFNMHVNSGGNDIVSLSDLQRYTGQVISTPGYSSSSSNAHNNDKEIPSIALEFANSSLQQRVQVNVQDGNVGSYMGSGTGSGLQQRSYSLANGALNGGSGTTISNIDQANGPETSEDCQPATLHATSHKPSQHNFDQQWGATIQSDAYGISSADSSASTSFCAPVTSSGSAMDNQHWNSLQSIHKIDSSLINNQLNLQATRQAANTEPESIDQRQKMDLQSPDVLQENLGQSHQQHQFQQIEQRQHQLKTSQQHQLLLTDVSSQSQATPDRGSQGKCEPGITQQFQHSQMQNQFQQNSVGNHSGITLTLPYASGSQYICSLPTQTSQQMQLLMHPNLVTADSGSESNCLPSEVQSAHLNRKNQFMNKKRWLLSLLHARGCSRPEGKCPEHNCIIAQQLLRHMFKCNEPQCPYPRCRMSKALVIHYKHCRAPSCSLCVPVKHCWRAQPQKTTPSVLGTLNYSQPSLKRLKIEQACQPLYSESKSSILPDHAFNHPHVKDVDHSESHVEILLPANSEVTGGKMETPINSGLGCHGNIEIKEDTIDDTSIWMPYADPTISKNESSFVEKEVIKIDEDHAKQENVTVPVENPGAPKFGKEKAKGVSLTELFTPEQVQQHLISLRCWVGQSKAKPGKNQAVEHVMKPNSCQLCGVEKLAFEPPPIYCTPCGARIKRNAIYYTVGAGDTRHYFCIPCYNEGRVNTSVVDGTSISKAQLRKKKNDEEIEESWVQCDKCEAWQHQICALFNGRRNDGGQAEYTCPNCYMAQIGRGEREPLPHNAVLGAKDLPRTILSDHIEQRLFRRLKQERQERARLQGRSYDEVPGAEELVIRVVSSADKRMEVKQRFLEIFQDKNYPTEFPYKSKVILLFQKIEGVEVCLFGLYVQEFGSECQQPNHRRVYLSYLDSVKYFRPDIRSFTGEALRTFVYHEILIGYLEYCKRRGFTSCYIWACPPLKGEDYILYCHPEMQKTPKSDKLREWYLSMLRKATKENIVVGLTNLYDHFFLSTGECKSKVTAARLPYFDGDYWPGAAEDMIYQLQQEEDGRKLHKKGITKKTLTRRALKASGLTDISETASKDFQLMHKLGETISRMKEDFIMVHLQHACNHCCILMVSGIRWICNMCKNFQICDTCNEAEQKLEERDKHPTNQKDKHVLCSVEIKDVPADTKDKDEILDSEFFDTRQAYLSLCQGNHYQYDTLRRAKHSSMMLLYHLHNPTAPAFVSTCNVCHLDVDAGQGLRCEICPDYDVCITCYQKDGGINHPHKLTKNPSMADHGAQNKEARQLRILKLRKMLDLLVHASQCPSLHCQYPYCRKLKELFYHGLHCKVRAPGGCVLCQNMWHLLRLHARACKESSCHVPRCRDLKDYFRREQQQSESRRRAAVMEMIRHC